MHPRATLVAAALLLAALPASAQSSSLLTPVALGDGAIGQALVLVPAPLRYIDGDGNGVAASDEPAYWDLDDSNSVSVGDLRLRAFRTHAAGTAVAVTDNDAGRALAGSGAWFGADSGAWYADLDASRSVTVADVRMADASSVAAGAQDLGRALSFPASGAAPGRAGVLDSDRDQRWDRGETAYLDLDTANSPSLPTVSAGDLRLSYATPPPASASSSASPGGVAEPDDDGEESVADRDAAPAEPASDGSGWGTPETVLLLLGLVNLVGLAYVAMRLRDGHPRNPFK